MSKEIEADVLEETATDDNEVQEILEDAQKESNEVTKNESPAESARKALEELQSGSEDLGTEDKTEDAPKEIKVEAQEPKKRGRPPLPKVDAHDPDLTPPERLELKHKEVFNKLPPELKKGFSKAIRDLEGMTTRATQENSKATNEARHVLEAVRPYLLANPHLAERGVTESAFVSGLVAAHQQLLDPKTKKQKWIEIGEAAGLGHLLKEGADQDESGQPDIANHPVVKQLIEQNNRLQQLVEPVIAQNRQTNQSRETEFVDSVTAELEAVQNETDSQGRYLNPELHEAEFVKRWNPLVLAIVGNTGKSPTEAARIALQTMRGGNTTASNNLSRAKLPANNRAVSAATSLRGRIAPVTGALRAETEDIPKNETPAQSAQRALDDLRRGLN